MMKFIRCLRRADIRETQRLHSEALCALLQSNALILESINTLITGDKAMTKEVDDMNTALGGMATAINNNSAAVAKLAQAQIDNKNDPAAVEAGAQQILALTAQVNTNTQAALDAAAALTSVTPTSTVPAPTAATTAATTG